MARRPSDISSLKEVVFIKAAPLRKTGHNHQGYHAGLFFTDGWAGPFLKHEAFVKCKNIGRYDVYTVQEFLSMAEGRNLLFKIGGISDETRLGYLLEDIDSLIEDPVLKQRAFDHIMHDTVDGILEDDNAIDGLRNEAETEVVMKEMAKDVEIVFADIDNRRKTHSRQKIMERMGIDVDSYDSFASAWEVAEKKLAPHYQRFVNA